MRLWGYFVAFTLVHLGAFIIFLNLALSVDGMPDSDRYDTFLIALTFPLGLFLMLFRLPAGDVGLIVVLLNTLMWASLFTAGIAWYRRRNAGDEDAQPCVTCGYDLRASRGACPECGAERLTTDCN